MSTPRDTYVLLLERYKARAAALSNQLGWLSALRLLIFLAFAFTIYCLVAGGPGWLYAILAGTAALFFILLRIYDRKQQEVALYRSLAAINQDEIAFLDENRVPFADGKEYIDPHHPYSYDLDLFGPGSLYPHLNRCSTGFGKQALANALLQPSPELIPERQVAVRELASLLDFRQHLQAHGALLDTREKEMRQLKAWLSSPAAFKRKSIYYVLLLFPLISTACLITYIFTENDRLLSAFYNLFVLNIILVALFARRIAAHLSVSTSVTRILQQFSGQFRQVEEQEFQSPLLRKYQEYLKDGAITASTSIGKLASLFNYLETVINLVVSLVLNGLFLFHIHILFSLEKWKARNGAQVIPWLEILGEVEALNSLANLSWNNPEYSYPKLLPSPSLIATDMGHPLISKAKRVDNSISFEGHKFIILTGSNMSGKSTFLRTLGINLVLARAGSVVCAKDFNLYPFTVHVSMRISDSLQDSESFFYAELKRLHAIIDELEKRHQIFVILDEILRGTNSNDKHNGTVGLIRKMIAAKAVGIIATHDLTVGELTGANPVYLSNKCFESEIINDELVFDYKLKEGVCTRLSASFLMKKMGVID